MLAGFDARDLPHGRKLLIQTILVSQTAEAADVSESEGEAEEILVANVSNRVSAILQGDAAAIPVVRGLRAHELQFVDLGIEAKTAGAAESALVGAAITEG